MLPLLTCLQGNGRGQTLSCIECKGTFDGYFYFILCLLIVFVTCVEIIGQATGRQLLIGAGYLIAFVYLIVADLAYEVWLAIQVYWYELLADTEAPSGQNKTTL